MAAAQMQPNVAQSEKITAADRSEKTKVSIAAAHNNSHQLRTGRRRSTILCRTIAGSTRIEMGTPNSGSCSSRPSMAPSNVVKNSKSFKEKRNFRLGVTTSEFAATGG